MRTDRIAPEDRGDTLRPEQGGPVRPGHRPDDVNTVGGHIADAVSDRLSNGLVLGVHGTLAGQGVDLSRVEDGTALTDTLTGLAQRFGTRTPADGDPFVRHGMGDGSAAPASTLSSSPASSPGQAMTGRELQLGSTFHVAGGGHSSGPGLAA